MFSRLAHSKAARDDSHDTSLQALSDEDIVLEVQRGNGDAFAVLFDRYHRLVLMTALKIVRDVSEAEEVTQNVFFEIYQAAGKFDPARGTLKVWLLQYAYHRSINRRNYLLLRQFYTCSSPKFKSGDLCLDLPANTCQRYRC